MSDTHWPQGDAADTTDIADLEPQGPEQFSLVPPHYTMKT